MRGGKRRRGGQQGGPRRLGKGGEGMKKMRGRLVRNEGLGGASEKYEMRKVSKRKRKEKKI